LPYARNLNLTLANLSLSFKATGMKPSKSLIFIYFVLIIDLVFIVIESSTVRNFFLIFQNFELFQKKFRHYY